MVKGYDKMSKLVRKIICVVGVSVFLMVGCGNGNTSKEQQGNKDKEIATEKDNETSNDDNSFNKNDATINNETKQKDEEKNITLNKQEYLDKMNVLDEELNVKLKDKLAGTTLEMREAASEIYKAWDEMLNEVYSEIISTLSKEEKDKLIAEEEVWIRERDKKADAAAKEVEGGTMEPLARISSLGTSTKERCYELVNNYMK